MSQPPAAGGVFMSVLPVIRIAPLVMPVAPQGALQADFAVNLPMPAVALGTRPAVQAVNRADQVSNSFMLALQESATVAVSDREARRQAKRLLDALMDLQRAHLEGGGSQALQRLVVLSDLSAHAVDPALAIVVRSIQLRAHVEVARAALFPRVGDAMASGAS